jgi:hypothetical protein
MRRLILSISALSMMALVVGCVHTAGVCDCDGAPHKVIAVKKAEDAKELPKDAPKETPKEKDKAELDPIETPDAK